MRDEQANVSQMYRTRGSGGKPPGAGPFFVIFLEKTSYFNAIESHFARV